MKRKIVWLAVSCLMVAALILASCAPATTKKEEVVTPKEEVKKEEVKKEEVKKEEAVAKEEVVTPAAEKPKYGGVLVIAEESLVGGFDECFTYTGPPRTHDFTNEYLLMIDWARGPAGTGELSLMHYLAPEPENYTGQLAESWEMTDPTTMVFHIRKGVYWHDKPPVNGREMTAYDVAWSLQRTWNKCPQSVAAFFTKMVSIEATDKWTVVLKAPDARVAGRNWGLAVCGTSIYPPEAIEKYGDMNDWKNVIGTGPFIMADYVKDSSVTAVRNPNYWDKDPVGPGKGNQLPYLDGVKLLIIPDISSRMAALRTGKLDYVDYVRWEDAELFMKTNPELKYKKHLRDAQVLLYTRVDKPGLPFKDKRVRQALALAINNQEIVDTFYGGNAELFHYPVAPLPELKDLYIPLKELPKSVQELYEYHPDKAKQLLAEAGYPNGFKTEILSRSTDVDILSIVKAYWAKIGVDLFIDVKESAVVSTIGNRKAHNEMYFGSSQSTAPLAFNALVVTGDYSMVSNIDPRIYETYWGVFENYFDKTKRDRIFREFIPYLLDQNYFTVLPAAYQYVFWQPWVKNFHGARWTGVMDAAAAPRWIWLDQDLKEKMTGRR